LLQPIARLFAVVVIYKLKPSDSQTLKTLLRSAASMASSELELKILLWDNTPGGQASGDISKEILYVSAPDNPGLARAYNHALELAHDAGFDWLLTLDQDSDLPENFLARMVGHSCSLNSTTDIGAIVPQVTGDGRNLSPFQFAFGAMPRWFDYGFEGIAQGATYALNSAALVRVDALRQIGGYDPMFPLDVSDINLFHRLHHAGKKVYVAGDMLIHHDFSLLKKHGRMSVERYQALLRDECAFWDMSMGPIARLERVVRLAGRYWKDRFSPDNAAFSRLTLAELTRRLITPRKKRVADWKSWATLRCQASGQGSPPNNSASAVRNLR
jgi:GT2 family glycosyltransferase